MSIDTYKLTSMEEPTDEVLSQLMREAAAEARETNAEATLTVHVIGSTLQLQNGEKNQSEAEARELEW